jgi:hypothetical protein
MFRVSFPDPDRVLTAPRGGTAIRLRDVTSGSLTSLWVVAASEPEGADVRIYDVTTTPPATPLLQPKFDLSNRVAHATAEAVTGMSTPLRRWGAAAGDGPSAGLLLTIAYLDVLSDGSFTDGVAVTASGTIGADGLVGQVGSGSGKSVAAAAAGVEVMFANSEVDPVLLEMSLSFGVPDQSVYLRPWSSSRSWDLFTDAGARWADARSRTPVPLSVVQVRHIGDVAAWLCGAGSEVACSMLGSLASFTFDVPSSDTSVAAAVRR